MILLRQLRMQWVGGISLFDGSQSNGSKSPSSQNREEGLLIMWACSSDWLERSADNREAEYR